MKKTLTVNLGGTVFHIDEDAYRLLDNYLCNLRLHFRKQEGAEEIVNDIENRISELFAEKLSAGSQVITRIPKKRSPKRQPDKRGHSKVRPFGADYIVILTIRYWVV